MRAVLLLLAAATVVAVKETERHPVSTILPNAPAGGSIVIDAKVSDYENFEGKKDAKLLTSYLKVQLDALREDNSNIRQTTLTYQSPIGTAVFQPFNTEGCVEARFWTKADLVKTELKPKSIIIFREQIEATDLAKFVNDRLGTEKTITLAFAKRFAALTAESRKLLREKSIAFIENVELHAHFDSTPSAKLFYAFKYVFKPFANASSVYLVKESDAQLHHDLIDLLIFDADDKLAAFCKDGKSKLVEISQKIKSNDFPLEKDIAYPKFETLSSKQWLNFSPYLATHMVGPYRFDQKKLNVSNLPEKSFFSPCYNLKLNSADGKPISRVSKQMLVDYEKSAKIPTDAILFLNTQWAKNWDNSKKYPKDYPTVDLDAVKFLVDERKAVVLGVDTLSFDAETTYKAHSYMASKNVGALLNVKLDDFPEVETGKPSQCVISYLRTADGTGAPAAIFVLPGLEQTKTVGTHQQTKTDPKKPTSSASTLAPSMALMAIVAAYFL